MLKLAIKRGEYVKIGDDIMIFNANDDGRQLRIAIAAPREIQIQRSDARVTYPKKLDRSDA